jgi:hypothetical protein
MPGPIDPPTLELEIDDLVDWLELSAVFSPFALSRTDALLGSLLEQENTVEVDTSDIGEVDSRKEQLIERIENEIQLRQENIGDAYPFELSESGEELTLVADWREPRYAFYLVCLVTTHVSGSAVLARPPVGNLLTSLRNDVFQIIATLGMAGLAAGPALSVGWPRRNGETIVQLMQRAAALGAGFSARPAPGPYVSPHEKDGGVDVIAWSTDGLPPPVTFHFAQTASGKNWPGKPVDAHARVFSTAYLLDHQTGNLHYATVIPYRVIDQKFWNSQSLLHRAILDRLRLPPKALRGLQLAESGVVVDGSDRLCEVTGWLHQFIDYAQAA